MLEVETLYEVKDFRYLGSIVGTHGGTEADVKKNISKARVAFHLAPGLLAPGLLVPGLLAPELFAPGLLATELLAPG